MYKICNNIPECVSLSFPWLRILSNLCTCDKILPTRQILNNLNKYNNDISMIEARYYWLHRKQINTSYFFWSTIDVILKSIKMNTGFLISNVSIGKAIGWGLRCWIPLWACGHVFVQTYFPNILALAWVLKVPSSCLQILQKQCEQYY